MQKLDEVVKKIPKSKDYITVPEAYALFGISKETRQQRRTAETLSSAEESSDKTKARCQTI